MPFVGLLTFTSDKETVKSLEKGESNSLETELKQKVAEYEKIKLKNFQMQQQVLTKLAKWSLAGRILQLRQLFQLKLVK